MLADVTITTREIYDLALGIREDVHTVQTKLDAMSDHESRIRKLERKLWIATGGAAVLGGSISIAATVVARLVVGA